MASLFWIQLKALIWKNWIVQFKSPLVSDKTIVFTLYSPGLRLTLQDVLFSLLPMAHSWPLPNCFSLS